MSVRILKQLEAQFLNDAESPGKITKREAHRIVDASIDVRGVAKEELQFLKDFAARNADKFLEGAAKELSGILNPKAIVAPPEPPATIWRTVAGPDKEDLSDDRVFLVQDGTATSFSGLNAFTRGYDATKQGILRFRHGSEAPESKLLSPAQNSIIRDATPGTALDRAAKAFGVSSTGFEKMANSVDFYNPQADFWWGKCHAWSWAALSEYVNQKVDVKGEPGKQGVWVGGEFLSRADLGNWMMAVADKISVNEQSLVFDSELSAMDLLAATGQFLRRNGGGFVSDVHNDARKGDNQVWNQPFIATELSSKTLTGKVADDILAVAKREGVNGANVKQVNLVGTYGVEVGDDHEDVGGTATKDWNIYAVTDTKGKVLTAFMAYDERLEKIQGIETWSDDVPEYVWKPTLNAITDTVKGESNWTVDSDQHKNEFKFFVQTVLEKGVPASVRAKFEEEMSALGSGPIDATKAADLATRFGKVANAYSPDQWKQLFGARGLDAKAFGATW